MRIYIVQKGDTLDKIAEDNNVDIQTLIELNSHISSAEYIVPGMKIKIPKTSIHLKEKFEVNKEGERPASDAFQAERPLGTMDGLDEKNNEMQHMRIPSRSDESLNQRQHLEALVEKEMNEEEEAAEAETKRDEKEPRPYLNQFEHEERMSHYFHSEHGPAPYYNRKMAPPPSFYYAPFPIYCPICMQHWQMHHMNHHPMRTPYRPKRR